MAIQKYTNNATDTLNGAITNVQTTITLNDASEFPSIGAGEQYYATITDGTNIEIVLVTDDASAPTLTVTRAQQGTTAQAFADGTTVSHRYTAADGDNWTQREDTGTVDWSNITAFDVFNFSFSANTISSSNTDGDITLDPNGDGDILCRTSTVGKVNFGSADYTAISGRTTISFVGNSSTNVPVAFINDDNTGAVFFYFNDSPTVALTPCYMEWFGSSNARAYEFDIINVQDKITIRGTSVVDIQGDTYTDNISIGDEPELTIATGAVTITDSFHRIDTEADAATDDLDTINGGRTGMLLVITAMDSARTVVAKDGTGNLDLAGDFSMDNNQDTLTLIYSSATSTWKEISRSDNGA